LFSRAAKGAALGQYPAIDLKTAREAAGRAKDKVEQGQTKRRKESRQGCSSRPGKRSNRDRRRTVHLSLCQTAIAAREVERLIEKEIVNSWRGRRLSEIRRPDIHDLLDSIVERGSPVTANRTFSWFRRMCAWAIERGLIEVNPCLGIKRCCCGLGELYAGFMRLLILTGARLSEVSEMRVKNLT
jgi:integrase